MKGKTMRREMPSQEVLNQLLRYDAESGKLYWRERPACFFEGGKYPADRAAAAWNGENAGKEAFISDDGAGYKTGAVFNKKYRAHRIIWRMITGDVPDQVDHADHDRSNNRWANLRSADQVANSRNMRLRDSNTSGVCGVHFARRERRWIAHITLRGRFKSLGSFPTKAAAMAARKDAEIRYSFHSNHGKAATR